MTELIISFIFKQRYNLAILEVPKSEWRNRIAKLCIDNHVATVDDFVEVWKSLTEKELI